MKKITNNTECQDNGCINLNGAKKIALIGECMLEISDHTGPGLSSTSKTMSFGGDTLNTSIYLSRAKQDVHFVSALGHDPYSFEMMESWKSEGINCDFVSQINGRLPGLYMIETDEVGERSFHYWRDNSPAREIFEDEKKAKKLFEQLISFDLIFLSGITLSLYNDVSLDRLLTFLKIFREKGGVVVFDSNFRRQRWPDLNSAVDLFSRVYQLVDVALPTLEDDLHLFGLTTVDELKSKLLEFGVKEIVIKDGAKGCWLVTNSHSLFVEAIETANVIDTTGAGDSFNAGYLSGRLDNANLDESARRGHYFASQVIQGKGAIVNINLKLKR